MANNRHPQLNIKAARELLSPYLDDEVTAAERQQVEAALATSPELQAELEQLRETVALLSELPPMPAPRPFTMTAADMGQPTDAPDKSRSKSWFRLPLWAGGLAALAAMLLLVLGGGLFLLLPQLGAGDAAPAQIAMQSEPAAEESVAGEAADEIEETVQTEATAPEMSSAREAAPAQAAEAEAPANAAESDAPPPPAEEGDAPMALNQAAPEEQSAGAAPAELSDSAPAAEEESAADTDTELFETAPQATQPPPDVVAAEVEAADTEEESAGMEADEAPESPIAPIEEAEMAEAPQQPQQQQDETAAALAPPQEGAAADGADVAQKQAEAETEAAPQLAATALPPQAAQVAPPTPSATPQPAATATTATADSPLQTSNITLILLAAVTVLILLALLVYFNRKASRL